uniref:Expressed protein n=1 Tax=Schizophyllum commune (strain H4-8 / FGSC 9210) TaxID=578458 RepID=D8PU73_SCHCM
MTLLRGIAKRYHRCRIYKHNISSPMTPLSDTTAVVHHRSMLNPHPASDPHPHI